LSINIILSSIAGAAWLLVAILVVFTVINASRGRRTKPLISALVIALIAAALLNSLSAGIVFVQPEQRGVVISALTPQGYREETLDAGLHWVFPYVENVIYYPISKQTYTMSIAPQEGQIKGDDSVTARTLDGQEIFVDASVIFHIDPAQIIRLHIAWQGRYSHDLVRPLARGVIRDAVSQFAVEQVYSSKRMKLTKEIEETMSQKLLVNGLILDDFILRNITFSKEYAASIEQKQIAEQRAREAAFVVEQKAQEAEQARKVASGQADAYVIKAKGAAEARLIQAKAEAEALDKIAAALRNNPDLLTYQYINKLAPGIKVMLVPNSSPYLLPLPDMDNFTNSNPATSSGSKDSSTTP